MTKSNLIYCLDNIATFIESQIDYLTYVDNIDNKTKDCFTFYASSTEPITLGGEGMEWYVTDMTSHIIMLIEINENKKSTLNLAVKEKAFLTMEQLILAFPYLQNKSFNFTENADTYKMSYNVTNVISNGENILLSAEKCSLKLEFDITYFRKDI